MMLKLTIFLQQISRPGHARPAQHLQWLIFLLISWAGIWLISTILKGSVKQTPISKPSLKKHEIEFKMNEGDSDKINNYKQNYNLTVVSSKNRGDFYVIKLQDQNGCGYFYKSDEPYQKGQMLSFQPEIFNIIRRRGNDYIEPIIAEE